MNETERDIIAALLKIVHKNGLIPDATYKGAINRLNSTYDKEILNGYDREGQRLDIHC